MRVAFGLKAHSGWAVLVVIGIDGSQYRVVERRRIELGKSQDVDWPGQPYHAAEGKPKSEARAIVQRGSAQARRMAVLDLRSAVARMRDAAHEVVACAVLIPEPMPNWSTEEILAVHLRMHKAEGVLYPDALQDAAAACGLNVAPVRERQLVACAEAVLKTPTSKLKMRIVALGKTVGAPWGADQKSAALAAMIALATRWR